jgi:hypothetical protein
VEEPVDLTVQVTADVAPALKHEAPATERASAIEKTVQAAGSALRPLHPGTADETLSRYFALEVPDATSAQRVARELLRLDGVEAAYVKPPDALP